ncbi:unnamed protein product [Symbiodinium sp. CCMP2592]|nr:unnamed protein product [Symbiodinium sp. CCMP2592]
MANPGHGQLAPGEGIIQIEDNESKVWEVPVSLEWWNALSPTQQLEFAVTLQAQFNRGGGHDGCINLCRDCVPQPQLPVEAEIEGEKEDDKPKAEGKKKKKKDKRKAEGEKKKPESELDTMD